jgi:hypothetical protein
MPYSYNQYTGDGSTQQFSISYPYISRDHIEVYLDGVETEDFTFLSDTVVNITTAPGSGVVVRVARNTPKDDRLVDFVDGSTLLESDLDTAVLQQLYIAQEAFDKVEDSLGQTAAGLFDANNTRIINVATPVDNTDAATKAYADTNLTLTAADVVAAESAKTDAEAARDAALAALDNFDDRFLGTKASDPSLDNDGDPLTEGVFYWNTTSNLFRVYDGADWANMTVSNGDLAALDQVDTAQIVDSAVTTIKIADAAITAAKASVASQAEAEAGTDTTKLMTPERVKQAIEALTPDSGSFKTLGTIPAGVAGSITDDGSWSTYSNFVIIVNYGGANSPVTPKANGSTVSIDFAWGRFANSSGTTSQSSIYMGHNVGTTTGIGIIHLSGLGSTELNIQVSSGSESAGQNAMSTGNASYASDVDEIAANTTSHNGITLMGVK